MNSLISLNTIRSVVTFCALSYFAFLPNAQAVVPPPDGGYPGFNTAEGQNALFSLTTGSANTAVGWYSLFSNTDGSFNTATGAAALLFNTADNNTAFGAAALLFNTTGSDNTAVGTAALENNTATGNTAVGSRALFNNTTGGTLENIQGVDVGPNVAVGLQALESNTVASANTAVGYQALQSFTTGLPGFEQVGLCTAVGFQALANATGSGVGNSAFGYLALVNDTEGSGNTAVGFQALFNNTSGDFNMAIGGSALSTNTTGSNNTAMGNQALSSNTSGSNNTVMGISAGAFVTTANNVICIGHPGENVDNSCYIGQIFGVTSSGGTAVFINGNGKLGTTTSSKRFKQEIKPMDKASEALFSLKPVSFRYKKEIDPAGASQLGLVAEDVEKVSPDLVVRDKDGKPYTVRYDHVNAMLLNEFLKEHRKVEELEANAARQQKQIDVLTAGLQKVSAEIEASKPAAQVVLNNQ